MSDPDIELLQRMPIFGGIREDVLQYLLELSPVVSVRGGNFFFHENDKADSMFVLKKGEVAVVKSWEGSEHLLRTLGAGGCFGEMALMDLQPRSASAFARMDCTAIELTNAALYAVYQKDLEQFALIQMNMGREVSRRLRDADARLFRARVGIREAAADYVFRA